MLLIQRNISRWARALDASKPMPIYMSEELPDLPEYSAINRAVPQMPSGMEKEEECEHHLQRAIVTGLIIPTPEVIHMGDTSVYNRLYPPTYKVPRQLIHMQPFAMKQDIPDYDMDSEDEHWVNAQMKVMDITPLKFEEIMDRLEKNSGHSVVTQSEAKLLLKEDDDLIISVYDYWLNKRLKTQTPLIPWVKTEAHRGGKNNNSPYLAFRRRTEKMQTRKNRKNDETSYEKMVKLRRDLSRALTLLELVKRRENTKRELFHLTIEVYEKRYQANDFSGHLLAEVSAIKHSRPAFAPLFINQYDVHGHSANWTKSPKEDSTPRKEKRQYKKRKHKTSSILTGCVLTPGDTIPGLLSSGNDEIILPRQSPNSEEIPFVFHRNKLCKYQAPISNGGLGNWPWCSREEGGMADRKFRYSLTSIATPKTRCIGFTRRRLGRGGRIILDRAGSSMDEYWASMDFTILDSTKEKERLSMELSRDYLHYCPAQETPSVFNSNSLTLQVEDLSDPSTNDHFTNVQLNLNELFPSIADTFPVDGSPGFSMDVDSKEYCVKVDTRKEISAESRIVISEQTDPFVYGNSNFLKQSSSTASLIEKFSPSLTNSNILVKEDKSTPVNLNCAAPRRNLCTVLNNERKENSNGSLLDRWARFKCNPEPRETEAGIKRSKFNVSQLTGNPASSRITPGHLQNVCGRQVRTFVNTRISSSKKDGSSNGDDRKDKDKEETINKLNALLKVMVEEDSSKALTASQSLELAKPKKRFNKKSEEKQKGLGNQLKDAAKHVADTIGGNTQETEMVLLGKLLGTTSTSSANLNELLSGMKVEQKSLGEMSRAQQVRSALQRGSPRQTKNFEQHGSISERLRTESHIKLRKRVGMHVDIFGAEPSNYFVDIKPATDIPKMETWENCLNRELRLSVTHPPSNIYEQIMIWTERGIFWKFPIDNEQGLEDEKQVSFEDHIFLETHLEGWCPEKGPIKHFMELVIVGLSKNFWMTAEEKKQHIFWYRDYFKDKNTLLQELGAGNIGEAEGQNENAAQTLNA